MKKNIKLMGCGYIGKKIAHILQQKKIKFQCFVNTDTSKKKCEFAGFDTIEFNLDECDVGLNEKIKSTFIHSTLAYLAPPQAKGKTDLRMANFIAMLETLNAPPEKIILISTTGVYGDCQGQWIDEAQPLNPQADRAHRRMSAETQLQEYCEKKQRQYIILRVPGIYAADKLPLKRIKSGEPIVSAADSGFTNRIQADDLSAFCVEALVDDVASGIYNCCDGNPSTMNDYFMKVADAMNLSRPEEISLLQAKKELSAGMLSYLAESKRISNKKLLTHFKTTFKYKNLDEGLKNLN